MTIINISIYHIYIMFTYEYVFVVHLIPKFPLSWQGWLQFIVKTAHVFEIQLKNFMLFVTQYCVDNRTVKTFNV